MMMIIIYSGDNIVSEKEGDTKKGITPSSFQVLGNET